MIVFKNFMLISFTNQLQALFKEKLKKIKILKLINKKNHKIKRLKI